MRLSWQPACGILHVPSTRPYEVVDLLPMVQQAAGAPPILGQLYLPRDSYILSADAGGLVREALEAATWGRAFGRDEEVTRLPARAILSLLARACKGRGQLRSLLAHSDVDGLKMTLDMKRFGRLKHEIFSPKRDPCRIVGGLNGLERFHVNS